jgi:hypothetical protein
MMQMAQIRNSNCGTRQGAKAQRQGAENGTHFSTEDVPLYPQTPDLVGCG